LTCATPPNPTLPIWPEEIPLPSQTDDELLDLVRQEQERLEAPELTAGIGPGRAVGAAMADLHGRRDHVAVLRLWHLLAPQASVASPGVAARHLARSVRKLQVRGSA
jgi:hypothetical protein